MRSKVERNPAQQRVERHLIRSVVLTSVVPIAVVAHRNQRGADMPGRVGRKSRVRACPDRRPKDPLIARIPARGSPCVLRLHSHRRGSGMSMLRSIGCSRLKRADRTGTVFGGGHRRGPSLRLTGSDSAAPGCQPVVPGQQRTGRAPAWLLLREECLDERGRGCGLR